MENAILQLTRIFGAFAFKSTHAVEVFKNKLLEVYSKYPEFKIFNEIYIKEIALKDINENLTDEVKENRKLLKRIMTRSDFKIFESEWWHYNLKNARSENISNFKWHCN